MAEAVKGFMLFANQKEYVDLLTVEQKADLLDALYIFGNGESPVLTDKITQMAFTVIRQSIERVWEFNEKQRENGSKGGRPRTKQNPSKPNESQKNPKKAKVTQANPSKPNESLKSESESESINTPLPPKGGVKARARPFTPPTMEEVQAYCDERGNGIDAQHFCDYYAVRGWRLKGGDKMQDWKACVRTWEKTEGDRTHTASTVPRATTVAQQRQQERQIMARMLLEDGDRQKAQEKRDAHGNRIVTQPDGTQLTLPPGW